jgi:hypothetical protein
MRRDLHYLLQSNIVLRAEPTPRRAAAAALRGVSAFAARGLVALALVMVASAARADAINNKFDLSAGIFILTTDTTVRIDGTAVTGKDFNLERDLGLTSNNSFRVDGYWRFATRHKIRFEYFDEVRSAEHTISKDIVFGDTTFPVDTTLNARVKQVTLEAAYEYGFLRGEKYELAGSVGIHDMYYKLSASAVGETTNASASARADVNGPLPVIGLHYLWQFTPEWNLDALIQLFMIKVNPYDGTLQDYNLSVAYMPTKHFGAGLGWNQFILRAGVNSPDFNGHLSSRYGGLRLFVKFSY